MKKIGFCGCGNMGSAMVKGILDQGICGKEDLIVSHLTESGCKRSRREFGVEATTNVADVVKYSPLVFLAVKPQFYEEVLTEIRPYLTTEHVLVGIAPGKTLDWIRKRAVTGLKAARFMPNTPAMVGEGMTAVCMDEGMPEDKKEILLKIAGSFGKTQVVPERLIDAAGAVSGCSPAFVYQFIESMADAGVLMGMPRVMAYEFASQTVLGSAKMVLESGLHPGELKDMVTSPGGTTIEGIRTLEREGMRGAVMEALISCWEKGKKM